MSEQLLEYLEENHIETLYNPYEGKEIPPELKECKFCNNEFDINGLCYAAINTDFGLFPCFEEEELDYLGRNHPRVLEEIRRGKMKGKYRKVAFVKFEKYLVPFITLKEYDGAETLDIDITNIEKTISNAKVKKQEERINYLEELLKSNNIEFEPANYKKN